LVITFSCGNTLSGFNMVAEEEVNSFEIPFRVKFSSIEGVDLFSFKTRKKELATAIEKIIMTKKIFFFMAQDP